MNCNAVKNVLDLFSEGRLTPARLAQIKGHLSSCESCSREALAFARLRIPSKIAAPAALKAKLEKLLAAPPVSAPEPERQWSFGEAIPVLAGATAYASLLIVLNLAGPGVTCERFDAASQTGEFR